MSLPENEKQTAHFIDAFSLDEDDSNRWKAKQTHAQFAHWHIVYFYVFSLALSLILFHAQICFLKVRMIWNVYNFDNLWILSTHVTIHECFFFAFCFLVFLAIRRRERMTTKIMLISVPLGFGLTFTKMTHKSAIGHYLYWCALIRNTFFFHGLHLNLILKIIEALRTFLGIEILRKSFDALWKLNCCFLIKLGFLI